MKIKSRSDKPVDPSNILWALSCKISESHHAQFNFNFQQDAAELLQFVIDELKGTSVAGSHLISNITTFCSKLRLLFLKKLKH